MTTIDMTLSLQVIFSKHLNPWFIDWYGFHSFGCGKKSQTGTIA